MGKIVYNGREYLSAGTASTMQGATSTTDGVSGLVPQPLIADREKVLKGDGTWGYASEVEANPSGTATDTLQKVDIDGTIYEIQGGGGGGSNLIVNAQIYSTDEKVVGVWKDGKPLYQKTIPFTLNAQPTHIDISSLDIDSVVNESGFVKHNTINYWLPIPYYEASGYNLFTNYDLDNGNVDIYSGSTVYTYYKNGALTIQYTKTTNTAGSGGYQAWGFSPIIYSTEEREIGVWTDNKPLYQKTIVQNNLNWGNVNGVNSSIAHGVSNLDKCVGLKMSCPYLGVASSDIINNGNTGLPLASFRVNTTNVYCVGGNGFYSGSADRYWFITILYTKSTDTAGSGSYNTLGVPNVHYSTDEQVIGTWIDGKPLYQKTYNITLTENVTYLDTSALNIKRLIEIIGQCDSNNGNNALFVPYYEDSTWRMHPQMDYANQQLSIVTTTTVRTYYSKLSFTIKYTKTTD